MVVAIEGSERGIRDASNATMLPCASSPASQPEDLSSTVVEMGSRLVVVLRYRPGATSGRPRLTRAEEIVLRAIFAGKSNAAIARERGTSARTVANQIASIFRKHGVGSRRELVAAYLKSGEPKGGAR